MVCKGCDLEKKLTVICPLCELISYCSLKCRIRHWQLSHHVECQPQQIEKLSQYEEVDKGQLIGYGSFAKVKLVKYKETGEFYAMKVIDKNQFDDQQAQELIMREIQVHQELRHNNIIKLFDVFEDDQNIYMILEYAQNGSLFNEIRRDGIIPTKTVKKYLRQICKGIKFLHDNQIIHRDIKPENILLNKRNHIKICDFGWSYQGKDTRKTFCGTVEYMAPEMITAVGHSYEVDIWALGVLLYEMTHGYAPFQGQTQDDKFRQIMSGQISFRPNLSSQIADFIRKCLQQSPVERPTIDDLIQHEFLASRRIQQGMSIRYHIENYGICSGEIQSVASDECQVYFERIDKVMDIPLAKIRKIIKRVNFIQNNGLRSRTVSPTPALTQQSPRYEEQEVSVLDQVELWCNNTKRSRRRRNNAHQKQDTGIIQDQDQNLEQSLQQIQNQSIYVNDENIIDIQEDSVQESNDIKYTPDIRESQFQDSIDDLRYSFESASYAPIFSQRPSGQLVQFEEESYYPIKPTKPQIPQLKIPRSKQPVQESSNSSFNSTKQGRIDYQQQRQKIESQTLGFFSKIENYSIFEEKLSECSLVSKAEYPTYQPDERLNQYDNIIKQEREIFRKSAVKSQQRLDKNFNVSSAALVERQSQLQDFLDEFQQKPVQPIRMSQPLPRPKKKQGNGFLRWLGSVIGCADRY